MKRKMKARVIIIAVMVSSALSFLVFVRTVFNIGDFQSLKIADVFYINNSLFYICGPEPMKNRLKQIL